MATETPTLPTIAEVDAISEKLGSAMSDLDFLANTLERMAGETISLEEYVAARKANEFEPYEALKIDAERFASLLVFARDAVWDAEAIRDDAERLTRALLSVYRTNVIDAETRRVA